MSSTKYAYKELPKFEPMYYRYWANAVKDALAERDWMNYLIPPAFVPPSTAVTPASDASSTTSTVFTPDPITSARVKAFLTQSIDFRYQAAIEHCTSAAEIWSVFQARYGQRSRDDELRLEAELLSLVKLSTQTLDQYIERFDDLIASIRAQQESAQ